MNPANIPNVAHTTRKGDADGPRNRPVLRFSRLRATHLWTKRIDAAFRDRAPRMGRVDGADEIVVEQGQVLSGIGLLSNTGVRFEAPETISGRARVEDVPRGGYDPDQHLRDMRLDGVAGEVLYPSPDLFYFRVADPALMSAIFRAYNHHLHF